MASEIFIRHQPYSKGERELAHYFKQFGLIRNISMHKGDALVVFDDLSDAEDALRVMERNYLNAGWSCPRRSRCRSRSLNLCRCSRTSSNRTCRRSMSRSPDRSMNAGIRYKTQDGSEPANPNSRSGQSRRSYQYRDVSDRESNSPQYVKRTGLRPEGQTRSEPAKTNSRSGQNRRSNQRRNVSDRESNSPQHVNPTGLRHEGKTRSEPVEPKSGPSRRSNQCRNVSFRESNSCQRDKPTNSKQKKREESCTHLCSHHHSCSRSTSSIRLDSAAQNKSAYITSPSNTKARSKLTPTNPEVSSNSDTDYDSL